MPSVRIPVENAVLLQPRLTRVLTILLLLVKLMPNIVVLFPVRMVLSIIYLPVKVGVSMRVDVTSEVRKNPPATTRSLFHGSTVVTMGSLGRCLCVVQRRRDSLWRSGCSCRSLGPLEFEPC